MDTIAGQVHTTCPPHHWVIGNEVSETGTVEHWRCQRCGLARERQLSRRRPLAVSKRYIGEESSPALHRLGYGGERVA